MEHIDTFFTQFVFADYSFKQFSECSFDSRTTNVSPTSSFGLASPTEVSRLARSNSDYLSHDTIMTDPTLVFTSDINSVQHGILTHDITHTYVSYPSSTLHPPTISLLYLSFSPLIVFLRHAFQRSPGILWIQELGTPFTQFGQTEDFWSNCFVRHWCCVATTARLAPHWHCFTVTGHWGRRHTHPIELRTNTPERFPQDRTSDEGICKKGYWRRHAQQQTGIHCCITRRFLCQLQ